MAPQTFEYFFDLPPELREQVLCHVCLFPYGILVKLARGAVRALPGPSAGGVAPRHHGGGDGEDDDDEAEELAEPPVNLFLASPVLYREAAAIYYGRNVFHLDLEAFKWGRKQRNRVLELASTGASTGATAGSGSGSGRKGGRELGAALQLLADPNAAGARRRIRSVVVNVRRFGAMVQYVLVPVLEAMVLDGGLRKLRVHVPEPGRGYSTDGYNLALRALLVVLTDPDLEKAELTVAREAHASFWCRFHEEGASEGGGDGTAGCGMSRGQGGRGNAGHDGGELLQVDIPRLVDVCADGDAAEFRIKRIVC